MKHKPAVFILAAFLAAVAVRSEGLDAAEEFHLSGSPLYRHFGKRANSFYVPQVDNAVRSEACSLRSLASLLPSSLNMKRLAKRDLINRDEHSSVVPPLTQALRNLERRMLYCDRINHAAKVRLV